MLSSSVKRFTVGTDYTTVVALRFTISANTRQCTLIGEIGCML